MSTVCWFTKFRPVDMNVHPTVAVVRIHILFTNKMIEPEHGMRHNSVPAHLSNQSCGSVVAPVGLPATKRCEPRQARKGAAAAAYSGAGVRWTPSPSVIVVVLFRKN